MVDNRTSLKVLRGQLMAAFLRKLLRGENPEVVPALRELKARGSAGASAIRGVLVSVADMSRDEQLQQLAALEHFASTYEKSSYVLAEEGVPEASFSLWLDEVLNAGVVLGTKSQVTRYLAARVAGDRVITRHQLKLVAGWVAKSYPKLPA